MEGNIGAGGGIAPGNGFQGINPPGVLDKTIGHGFEGTRRTVTLSVVNYAGDLLEVFQKYAQSLSISGITGAGQFSPGNLLQGVNLSTVKMGDMYGRGGGK